MKLNFFSLHALLIGMLLFSPVNESSYSAEDKYQLERRQMVTIQIDSRGYDQTISQPYIVAYMTEQLKPKKDYKALEIGTGSGYQAAVLSKLVSHVYTIEIIEELGQRAKKLLTDMKYKNISVKIGDGYLGWEENAPYDIIIVTAAPDHIPPPLVKQLKPEGVMCIPVGGRFQVQNLTLVRKDKDGLVRTKRIMPVRFVPLTRMN